MRDHRVAGVRLVVDKHLPVATVHVAQHAACDFKLSDRRSVDHVVEARQAVAEEFLEARPFVVQPREDEAAIIAHVLQARHALRGGRVPEAGILVALRPGQAQQGAVGAEAPRVIGASEYLARIAAGFSGDLHALVRAAVEENLHLAVGMAHHDDGLRTDGRRIEIALVRHLAVVADIDPGVGEEMLHLELEQFLVDEDVAMDFRLAHEFADLVGVAGIM